MDYCARKKDSDRVSLGNIKTQLYLTLFQQQRGNLFLYTYIGSQRLPCHGFYSPLKHLEGFNEHVQSESLSCQVDPP